MKEAHTVQEPTKFPQFWTEEWLKVAIDELDTRRMTPEERMAYVMTLSNNAIAVQMENERKEEFAREATERVKRESIIKAIRGGKLADAEIADYNSVSIEYVSEVKNQMNL